MDVVIRQWYFKGEHPRIRLLRYVWKRQLGGDGRSPSSPAVEPGLIFVAVLGVGLLYLWKKGALEWE